MFISNVVMDRAGREFFIDPYPLHSRLAMAFPTAAKVAADPYNLDSFVQEHFGVGQTHTSRTATTNYLYRIDALAGERFRIIVQSAMKPDLEYAFSTIRESVLDMESKPVELNFNKGDKLCFNLRMDPTARITKNERLVGKKRDSFLPTAQACDLVRGKLKYGGSDLLKITEVDRAPKRLVKNGKHFTTVICNYTGIIEVTEPDKFLQVLIAGFGRNKMWGCGLMLTRKL